MFFIVHIFGLLKERDLCEFRFLSSFINFFQNKYNYIWQSRFLSRN